MLTPKNASANESLTNGKKKMANTEEIAPLGLQQNSLENEKISFNKKTETEKETDKSLKKEELDPGNKEEEVKPKEKEVKPKGEEVAKSPNKKQWGIKFYSPSPTKKVKINQTVEIAKSGIQCCTFHDNESHVVVWKFNATTYMDQKLSEILKGNIGDDHWLTNFQLMNDILQQYENNQKVCIGQYCRRMFYSRMEELVSDSTLLEMGQFLQDRVVEAIANMYTPPGKADISDFFFKRNCCWSDIIGYKEALIRLTHFIESERLDIANSKINIDYKKVIGKYINETNKLPANIQVAVAELKRSFHTSPIQF